MALPVVRSSSPATRWDPFRDFNQLHEQLDHLVQSFFGPVTSDFQGWQPLADLSETEQGYVVEIELPGVKRDDIAIEVVGNELAVTGEFKEKEREGLTRSRTRRTGHFEYRTLLPRDVQSDKITAELADGVLTLQVPKSEAAKPRRVEITTR